MEWNKTTVGRIHSIINVKVEKGKGGRINRAFSGLVFSLGGKVTYYMNGREYVSDGTNLIYLPAGGIYYFESQFDGFCPQINFDCDFDRCEFMSFPVADISIYEKKFEKLRMMYYNDSSGRAYHACLMAFYDILAMLDGEYSTSGHGEYVRRAIEIMSARMADPDLSNDAISAELNISTVYFRKLFYDEIGKPPMSYLRKMRMERAMELLKIPDISVGEVAIEVGYSGIYPFSRVFKRETGISPTAFSSEYKNSY